MIATRNCISCPNKFTILSNSTQSLVRRKLCDACRLDQRRTNSRAYRARCPNCNGKMRRIKGDLVQCKKETCQRVILLVRR